MASTTHRYGRGAAVLAVVVFLLGACGQTQSPGGQESPATGAPDEPSAPAPTGTPATPEPTGDPAPTGEDSARVEAAVADLAEHLGIAAAAVTVVDYEDVTWPDGALGCPQPGMAYTQALVPGARLVLEADGVQYPYHGAADGPLERCDRTPLSPATN